MASLHLGELKPKDTPVVKQIWHGLLYESESLSGLLLGILMLIQSEPLMCNLFLYRGPI